MTIVEALRKQNELIDLLSRMIHKRESRAQMDITMHSSQHFNTYTQSQPGLVSGHLVAPPMQPTQLVKPVAVRTPLALLDRQPGPLLNSQR